MSIQSLFNQDLLTSANQISGELYQTYDVKRGLRNADGSGVLAGLSQISSVIGSLFDEGKSTPVEGILKLRGHLLADLVDQVKDGGFAFEKTTYLLLTGQLPDAQTLKTLTQQIDALKPLPQELVDHVLCGIPNGNKSVMNKLQTLVSALYGFDENPDDLSPEATAEKALSITAKFPAMVAYSYLSLFKDNPKFVSPEPGMSLAESLLYMLREGQKPSPVEVEVLDICLVLHAEHGGGNNSSFTTKVVTSSHSDIYSTTTASIGSLKGPLHGAASIKARLMMEDIRDHLSDLTDKDELEAYLLKILKKEAFDRSGKIFGLGHAVYTKSDPRAVVLKEFAKKLAKEKNREEELQLYFNVEEMGPRIFNAFKGSNKVISPNVDFFSGFVYDCLDIPSEIFTPLFATARVVGWSAHRLEELLSGKRIIRPKYKFVG